MVPDRPLDLRPMASAIISVTDPTNLTFFLLPIDPAGLELSPCLLYVDLIRGFSSAPMLGSTTGHGRAKSDMVRLHDLKLHSFGYFIRQRGGRRQRRPVDGPQLVASSIASSLPIVPCHVLNSTRSTDVEHGHHVPACSRDRTVNDINRDMVLHSCTEHPTERSTLAAAVTVDHTLKFLPSTGARPEWSAFDTSLEVKAWSSSSDPFGSVPPAGETPLGNHEHRLSCSSQSPS